MIDGVLVSDMAISNGINAVTRSNAGSNPAPTQDGQVNRIADINPEDIENVEILKGASAAAIYGSKASNGVVIISTKRGGMTGQPRLNFTQRVGLYQLANKLGARRFDSAEDAVDVFGEAAAPYVQDGLRYFDHEEQLAGRTAPATSRYSAFRDPRAIRTRPDTSRLGRSAGIKGSSGTPGTIGRRFA